MKRIQIVNVIFLLTLSACAPKVASGGYVHDSDIKDQIIVGQTTKDQVKEKLGSPSAQSTFGNETWYYITNRQETVAFFKPEIVKQDAVSIEFDSAGLVSKVDSFSEKDGEQFAMVKQTTPTEGHTLGFFEQLLGNIGRFNHPTDASDTAAPGRKPVANMSELEPAVPPMPNTAPRLYGIAGLVIAIVIIGAWLVTRFIAADLARDTQTWQEKLNLIAESRASDVNHWVENNIKELQTLADNPSLQLYMTELQMAKQPAAEAEPAQKSYLRNLLLFTAQRAGFGSDHNNTTAIPADLPAESKNGLGIVDANNQLIVSTPMQPAARDMLLDYAKRPASAQPELIDIRKDSDGTPIIGFIVPVFSIQGDHTAAGEIGRLVGIKTVGDNLFGLLKYPGATEKTLESILVRIANNKVEYLSPLLDGTAPLDKQAPFDPAKSAEATLTKTVGDFITNEKDYRDHTVLATSRAISGTPWTLVVKVDNHEALAQGDQRRDSMVVFFFLLIAIIVLIIVAVWWRAHSQRSLMLSGYFRQLAAQTTAQARLLRLVTNHQPEAIYIVDANHIFRFANQRAAADAAMSEESVPGKTLADMRGYARAEHIAQQCDKARKEGQVIYDVQRMKNQDQEKVIRSAYVPLDHIPIAELPSPTPGVLIVEQDISEVVHQREQLLETQRQLVEMLIRLVDKRDPFAANHSQMVAKIAYETAIGMGLDEVTADTTRTAASLMNIGKIVVPTELLTKTESLTADEKRIIHDSMNTASELLKNIRFDGPVADSISQWQEKWDGSGPLGLKGDAILMPARIIAVANTFIGMISPRSWRTAMTVEAANKFLLDQAGSHFDRRVVIALINYIENQSGSAWLQAVLKSQRKVA